MSSTETGAIFGNIVYEDTLSSGRNVVVLNDIHIDIMDYISPAVCADVQFRSMWAEFEWENKVTFFLPLTYLSQKGSCAGSFRESCGGSRKHTSAPGIIYNARTTFRYVKGEEWKAVIFIEAASSPFM